MIVPYQEILLTVGVADGYAIEAKHEEIEQAVKSAMGWEPESVTHTGKLYDGEGFPSLWLNELHIQKVTRVATVFEDAIGIKNTSDASNAFVEVTSTGIRLKVDDGANVDDTNTLFADYATITLMVAQLNTIGKGWTVTVHDSDYGGYASDSILPVDGFYVGAFGSNTAQEDYLSIAGEPIRFTVYKERGEVRRQSWSFPEGSQNIAIDYVSGWTAATMPADLKGAVRSLVKQWYNIDSSGTAGLKSYTVDGVSEVFDTASSNRVSSSGLTDSAIRAAIPIKYIKIG